MNESERRRAQRRQETFTVSLAVPTPLELEGNTVNLSDGGVLLTAHGKIPVTLDIKGQRYLGVLVRAAPGDGGQMQYAIQLTDFVEMSHG
jgi:hypothetical protein